MIIYLAGPMRHYPLYNFPAFDAAAAELRAAGYGVISPAEHDRETGFDERRSLDGFDLDAAMRWDLRQVLDADAVVVLPGWEHSSGARAEVGVAKLVGTPVMDLADALGWRR